MKKCKNCESRTTIEKGYCPITFREVEDDDCCDLYKKKSEPKLQESSEAEVEEFVEKWKSQYPLLKNTYHMKQMLKEYRELLGRG